MAGWVILGVISEWRLVGQDTCVDEDTPGATNTHTYTQDIVNSKLKVMTLSLACVVDA